MVKHKAAVRLEEQARACEYDALFAFDSLRPQLLEHMPVLDESRYARTFLPTAAVDMSAEPAAAQVSRKTTHTKFKILVHSWFTGTGHTQISWCAMWWLCVPVLAARVTRSATLYHSKGACASNAVMRGRVQLGLQVGLLPHGAQGPAV